VELTLNPHFRRHYTALNKPVVVDTMSDQELASLAYQTIGVPIKRNFHSFRFTGYALQESKRRNISEAEVAQVLANQQSQKILEIKS
jgi:hypothetical protein